jgi:ribosomal protein L24
VPVQCKLPGAPSMCPVATSTPLHVARSINRADTSCRAPAHFTLCFLSRAAGGADSGRQTPKVAGGGHVVNCQKYRMIVSVSVAIALISIIYKAVNSQAQKGAQHSVNIYLPIHTSRVWMASARKKPLEKRQQLDIWKHTLTNQQLKQPRAAVMLHCLQWVLFYISTSIPTIPTTRSVPCASPALHQELASRC